MTPLTMYVTGIALVVALALTVLLVLRAPLRNLLAELCGNERRASFWLSFWLLGVLLMTAFVVLATLPSERDPLWAGAAHVRTFLETLRSGVVGVGLGLGLLGFVLLLSVQAYETRLRREAAWAAIPPPSGPREPLTGTPKP